MKVVVWCKATGLGGSSEPDAKINKERMVPILYPRAPHPVQPYLSNSPLGEYAKCSTTFCLFSLLGQETLKK
jgi:hypothetical protein